MKIFNLLSFALTLPLVSSGKTSKGEIFKSKRYISSSKGEEPRWINNTEIFQLIKGRKTYADLTLWESRYKILSKPKKTGFNIPLSLSNEELTQKAQTHLNMDRAVDLLAQLTKFHTRFFLSEGGVQAGKLLKSHLYSVIQGYIGSIELEVVDHIWDQPSFIVRIKGVERPNQIAVLGAHYDSINQDDPFEGRAPGADDNGTGIVTLVEIIRSLIAIQYKPKRTIEFHFYAAEEVGLLGSLDIAFRYALENRQVVSMLAIDMIGYRPDDSGNISITTDFVDQKLSKLLKICYERYSKYPVILGKCGYACSDHAAWDLAGYNSVYPSEKVDAPGYHTEKDIIQDLDFEFLLQSANSILGFLIEISES